jgi:hypothetical protein
MLDETLTRIQQSIRRGAFTNEAAVSQGILLPVLNELGWNVFDPALVSPEYTVEGRRVDFALCARLNQPSVFVEVKRIGQTDGGDKQLFEYAFIRGVPFAVLTDGQQWDFFLPAEQGSIDDRRVYRLDILERTATDSAARLVRYLAFDRVLSEEALKAARADISDQNRSRQIAQALPKALEALVNEPDPLLVELLQARVADLCGYQPDLDTCARFLATVRLTGPPPPAPPRSAPKPPSGGVSPPPHPSAAFGFSWESERVRCSSAREVLQEILKRFAERDPSFLMRFVARKHGRKRRYVAQERGDLYPGRPDLAELYAVEFMPGWWLGTNYSRRSIAEIVDLACEVAGVERTALAPDLGE